MRKASASLVNPAKMEKYTGLHVPLMARSHKIEATGGHGAVKITAGRVSNLSPRRRVWKKRCIDTPRRVVAEAFNNLPEEGWKMN